MKVITLLTDLGDTDPFIGEMKGVIYKINPDVKIVDITNKIPMGDIEKSAFFISHYYQYFPEGTIHIVVVDPGVGGKRSPIVFSKSGHYFVGPDNGVFSLLFDDNIPVYIIEKFTRKEISYTFHGRDIFAPTAAWIFRGKPLKKFGKTLSKPVKIKFPEPIKQGDYIIGEVVYIDHFGNVITNIPSSLITSNIELLLENKVIKGISHSYDSVAIGEPLLTINSFGLLEVAVNGGNASKILNLKRHSPVKVMGEKERVNG